mgnify:CR=1 FL=1
MWLFFNTAILKKRVLLTGAAGAVGQEVLKELIKHKQEIEITAFAKDNNKHHKILAKYGDSIKVIYGDIRETTITDKLAKDIDFVIHLAAIIPPLADEKPQLAEEVNLGGTINLIKSFEKISPKVFFLFTSSIATYGDRVSTPSIYVNDELKPSLGDEYGKSKIKAEEVLRNSSLNWSIFRLSAIMHFKQKFDPLMFHMPLDTKMEICTTRDTAFALAQAINSEEKLNKKTFNLGGGQKCRTIYRDFLETSFKNSGLGENPFPEKAFATGNFHCGYYEDSHELNKILDFQRDTIEDYYRFFKKEIGPTNIFLAKIFRPFIIRFFLKKSDPYNALKNNDKDLIARFFPK